MKNKLISNFILTVLGILAIHFVFNAFYQARIYSRKLYFKNEIAVFVKRDGQLSVEVMLEKLRNTDGVRLVRYLAAEDVLRKAMSESPEMKDVLLPGENPFVEYFLVRPLTATRALAESLKERIENIDGVEEVRYDPQLIVAAEKLQDFMDLYYIGAALLFLSLLGVIMLKLAHRYIHKKLLWKAYAVNAATGLAAGITGTLIYVLIGYTFLRTDVAQFPLLYLITLAPTGIILCLALENQ
jgi:hypothetical protein